MESGIPILYQENEDDTYIWVPGIYLEETSYGYLVCTLVVVEDNNNSNKLNYTKYSKIVKRIKLPEYFTQYDCVKKLPEHLKKYSV